MPIKKRYILIIMVLAIVCVLFAAPDNSATRRRTMGIGYDFDRNTAKTRTLLPPSNLTAEIIENVNVQLKWDFPTDIVKISYHSGVEGFDGYFQYSDEAYGTVFDLTDYPDYTLEYIDFRHSSYDLIGEWDYKVLVLDFETRELIASYDKVTTVNDNWEKEVSLESLSATSSVGIFIVPLGNDPEDAFPVIDFDEELNGNSLLIKLSDYSTIEEAEGDFLIDLYIKPGQAARNTLAEAVPAPRLNRNRVDRAKTLSRNLQGYHVYRNEQNIAVITSPDTLSYFDTNLEDNTYIYYVTAVYFYDELEESEPTNEVIINIIKDMKVLFYDDFTKYPDFVTTFHPWTTIDLDGSITYGFTNNSFPNEYQPMAWMVFNPSKVTPPITTIKPHSGDKLLASFASEVGPNNKWLITPRLTLGSMSSLSFHTYSFTDQYGLERYKVGVSLTDKEPGSFEIIYPEPPHTYAEAPVVWTEVKIDLSEYDNQSVYIAIQNVSENTFVLFLDSFKVTTIGGSNIDENETIASTERCCGNYPNPFNPETTIFFNLKEDSHTALEVYNIKGQRVNTLTDSYLKAGEQRVIWNGKDESGLDVASGVYYYRIVTKKETITGRMLLVK